MTFSKYGALAEAFVMTALRQAARDTAKADPAKFENALISGKAWVGVAKEVSEKLEAFYANDLPAHLDADEEVDA